MPSPNRKPIPVVLGKDGQPLSKASAKLRMLKGLKCSTVFEKEAWASGAKLVAGVDEVGRGALFGPVVAAAVILNPDYRIKGLRDSKLLDAATRERLDERIREHALAIAIAAVDASTIDELNIYHATRRAMCEAVLQLTPAPDHLLVDAMNLEHSCPQTKIIYGDARSISIAAASIVAKVWRDRLITEMHTEYPEYDLASNKGYRSPKHIAALRALGPTPLHRMSFGPAWLNAAETLDLSGSPDDEAALTPVQRARRRAAIQNRKFGATSTEEKTS